MKTTIKLFGFMATVAIITFSMAACEQPTDPAVHEHQWGAWSTVTAATCTTPGSETRSCALDATHKETRDIAIDPNAHNYQTYAQTTAPTCLVNGEEQAACTRNNTHTKGTRLITALGHDYQNYTETTAPTCTTVGKEEAPCTRDSNHEKGIRDILIDLVNGHNWNTETGLCNNNCGELYYSLGDTGPGGGKIFYVSTTGFTMTDDNSTTHYLEAAPVDIATQLACASSAFIPSEYGGTGDWTDITGTATGIGTGRKNTALILAADANAPAAKACNDYNASGKIDWFLPSQDELNQLYVNRTSVGNMEEEENNCYYWSSSQGYDRAWVQRFSDGTQYANYSKNNMFSVRAVRAF